MTNTNKKPLIFTDKWKNINKKYIKILWQKDFNHIIYDTFSKFVIFI